VLQLVNAGAARAGLLYLAGTLVAALAAVYLGITVTRLATRRRRVKRHREAR
jgi:CrcB protein